jgi:hypothetical protein
MGDASGKGADTEGNETMMSCCPAACHGPCLACLSHTACHGCTRRSDAGRGCTVTDRRLQHRRADHQRWLARHSQVRLQPPALDAALLLHSAAEAVAATASRRRSVTIFRAALLHRRTARDPCALLQALLHSRTARDPCAWRQSRKCSECHGLTRSHGGQEPRR